MPASDILNPTQGWDATLGDSMNPSYGFTRKRANTKLNKKAVGGTPWTRETQNTGHTFQLSWLGRTWACIQRLKWYFEQYEDGLFTIVDWDGGGRQYVGRFTSEVVPTITANNKWDVQQVTFEEIPQQAMLEYPSDWAHDAVVFFINNDFGDQKLAFNSPTNLWAQTARTAAEGAFLTGAATPSYGLAQLIAANAAGALDYVTMDNPGTAAGDWACYEYRGYGFRLYMLQGPALGKCDVSIDSVFYETLNLYAAENTGPAMVLAQPDLPLDFHRVQITVDNTKDPDATGYAVSWYALEVMR
jgi:hypothetical protein